MAIDRPEVDVDVLEFVTEETHRCQIEGRVTRRYYECPNPECDARICEWMDCPECYWYDEDAWERTLDERSSKYDDQSRLATDGGRPSGGVYRIGDALEALADLPDASAKLIHLDDAWSRPRRCGGMGVEYPTHDLARSFEIVDECWRVLQTDGWLLADADDWFQRELANYLAGEHDDFPSEYGNPSETYEGGGYRRTGSVTYLRSDADIDRGGAGMYLRNAGYHVVVATKPEVDHAYEGARQVAHRPSKDWGWNSVKPLQPYLEWVSALCDDGDRVVVPCAGTAPAAVAAERLGLEWWACDVEPDARSAFQRRLAEQADSVQTTQTDATRFASEGGWSR